MSRTFAEVVEHVKQLSPEEKIDLHELLKKYLIQEQRQETREQYEAGVEELRNGELTSFKDAESLLDSLSHD